ncbi:type I DNA topoisomerase [soil metagenome]
MAKSLVIVESPSKAKTINKYLGKNFIVEATVGHIKNLPKSKISVDIENGFEPNYEVIPGKEKVLETIKNAARSADKIYIATDPDREGESIAADIADEIIGINKNIKRVLFNEITKSGVENAMKNPLEINENLVESQMARRVMDRILGYKVSPFLWKTFYFGLSAGRVQSVALKLIAEREKEIRKFIPTEYWSVDGNFSKLSGSSKSFLAKLYTIDDKIIKYDGTDPRIPTLDDAHKIIEDLKNNQFLVTDITNKEIRRNAPAPFTTSVLQQTASTRMGYSPKKTMSVAQKLYEGMELVKGEGNVGLITYMRTDSTRLSPDAIKDAREYIGKTYGEDFLPDAPKVFAKKGKNMQDAHEAIRPTDVNITPEMVSKLGKDYQALYDLIWKRFVASQMAQAVLDSKTVLIKALSPKGSKTVYIFKATGSVVKFSGYLKVHEENKEDDEAPEEDLTLIPGDLEVNNKVKISNLRKDQHFTMPPPRYTESSLIKQLDKLGIGRPSTFAHIVTTVLDRKYVDLVDRRLFATDLGMTVDDILGRHFEDVINVEFTAKMEEELDTVANGEATYKEILNDFYNPFNEDLIKADAKAKEIKAELTVRTDITCPVCGEETQAKMVKKWGRNGQFMACERYPKCTSTMPLDENERNVNVIAEGIKCDLCGSDMLLKIGRFGKFYGCSNYPKCKGVKPITLGIKCPKCETGEVLERKGGKGRVKRSFYACTRYPDCDFISNGEPVREVCKECKNNYLVKKFTVKDGKFLECPVCKARTELKEQSEEVSA